MYSKGFDPGPIADITSYIESDRSTLVFVRHLPAGPELVWVALTEPTRLRLWAPFTAERDLTSASKINLRIADGVHAADLLAIVFRATPPTLLEYSWGTDHLTWELAASGTGTRLTLHHVVKNSDWLPSLAAGWHLCLAAAERVLDGRPIEPIVGSKVRRYGWDRLYEAYEARLGIRGTKWPDDFFPTG